MTDSNNESSGPETPDRRLLDLIVCPVSKKALVYDADAGELISKAAKLAYPVRKGIPILLVEEARAIKD